MKLKHTLGAVFASILSAALMATAAPAQDLPEGATVAAEKAADKEVRIAFLSFQNNPFWIPVTDGAKAAKDYLSGFNGTVDYVDLGNELSAEAVVSGIEGALAQQYDGIVVGSVIEVGPANDPYWPANTRVLSLDRSASTVELSASALRSGADIQLNFDALSVLDEFDWANTGNDGAAFGDPAHAGSSNAGVPVGALAGSAMKLQRNRDGTVELYTDGALRFTTSTTQTEPVWFWVGQANAQSLDWDDVVFTTSAGDIPSMPPPPPPPPPPARR